MPGGKRRACKSIEAWPVPESCAAPRVAIAGQSVGITLDREIFVERGDLISRGGEPGHVRPAAARAGVLAASSVRSPSAAASPCASGPPNRPAWSPPSRMPSIPGCWLRDGAEVIAQNHVGEIEIALSQPIATDPYTADPNTGRIVLEFDGRIAGGGLVLAAQTAALDTTSGPRPARSRQRRALAYGRNSDELRAKPPR